MPLVIVSSYLLVVHLDNISRFVVFSILVLYMLESVLMFLGEVKNF